MKPKTKPTNEDMARAGRYLKVMDRIVKAMEESVTDKDVKRLERYLSLRESINDYGKAITDEDIKRTEHYLNLLKKSNIKGNLGQAVTDDDCERVRQYIELMQQVERIDPGAVVTDEDIWRLEAYIKLMEQAGALSNAVTDEEVERVVGEMARNMIPVAAQYIELMKEAAALNRPDTQT